jgi:hypothetical protein
VNPTHFQFLLSIHTIRLAGPILSNDHDY